MKGIPTQNPLQCGERLVKNVFRHPLKKMAALRAASAFALVATVRTNLYDVIQPHLIPPAGGCAEWASLPEQDKYWFGGKPPADAEETELSRIHKVSYKIKL